MTDKRHKRPKVPQPNPLTPVPRLLCKLGSIIVHIQEFGETGEPFDVMAMHGLLEDPEVKDWLKGMDQLAMIPKKRREA